MSVSDAGGVTPIRPDGLLETSWASRGRPMRPRERRIEGLVTLAFAAIAALLMVFGPGELELDPGIAVLVLAYAATTRVNFPIGLAGTVPTQLFLVPLFLAAPAELVPALIASGLAIGHLIAFVAGRGRLDRLVCVGGDALHAVGPALVLILAAGGVAEGAAPWVLALALAAQFGVDLVSGLGREHLISGVAPQVQTLVHVQIWAADLALAPIGYLVARATDGPATAAIALLPLVGLLAYAVRDRRNRIGTAHERLQALESERERLRMAVRRIGDSFAANLDPGAILDVITATVSDALQADASRLMTRGAPEPPVADDLTIALRDAEEQALRAGYLKQVEVGGVHSVACPLHALGAVLSVARRGTAYDAEERSLLGYLCRQADVAGVNASRHRYFQRQAVTDELTGLANHRRFQEVLDGLVGNHSGARDELALLLIDLDDFKLVNDSHGHLTGDEVLREVSRCLRENCRSTDDPARYGGEEFAVVVDGLELEQVLALAERVRQAIGQVVVSCPSGERIGITASFGIARMGSQRVSRRDLIAAADAALYEAKDRGKNRVAWVDLDHSASAGVNPAGSGRAALARLAAG